MSRPMNQARRPGRRAIRPRLEWMEDRKLPSTITVTNTADHGPGSLRSAIVAAAAGDSIQFALGRAANPKITLTTGELLIDKPLTITGPASGLTIDANSQGRVFHVKSATGTVEIDRLKI